jgi:hypothetical protein
VHARARVDRVGRADRGALDACGGSARVGGKEEGRTAADLEEVVVPDAHHLLSSAYAVSSAAAAGDTAGGPHRFTMIALSSMIQFAPITIGPAMAKMVAFGCTTVPAVCYSDCALRAGAGQAARTGADGDVALELDVLADDGLGVDRELVAAG